MQNIKETAANVAASAKSGMEKSKAIAQEKVERVTAHNPTEKELATERKEEKIHNAELNKQEAMEQNAAAKMASKMGGSHSYTAAGATEQATAGHHVTEGTVETHPIGTATGTTARPTTAHNTHVGGGPTGYSTGGGYSG